MTSDPLGTRTPRQERSRRTVQRLLDAAEARFAVDGFDRASVRAIAADAGIPVGSLYQYFDGKQAVLDALTESYVDALDDLFARSADRADAGLEAMVTIVVDGLIDLASDRPGFRAAFVGSATTGPFADAGGRLRDRLVDLIAESLLAANPAGGASYRRAAVVCTEVTRGLLPRVVGAEGRLDRKMRDELRTVLAVYLADVKLRVKR